MAKHRAELWSDPHPWTEELFTDVEVPRDVPVLHKKGYARAGAGSQCDPIEPPVADDWSQLLELSTGSGRNTTPAHVCE